MTDSALGSATGYLYQFEKALLVLSKLENINDYVSIESVDDVAAHNESGSILLTIQAKHSILSSGTTFGNTSKSLWRTFEIWIQKLEKGTFSNSTKFICSTNKKISVDSLLVKIRDCEFSDVLLEFKNLLDEQNKKLDATEQKGEAGNSIKATIKYIKFVLSKESFFKVIKENLIIEDEETIKEKFLSELHLGSTKYSDTTKNSIYEEFYGWITLRAKAKWMNEEIASFTKEEFDDKNYQIKINPSIINAVFRNKELLGTIDSKEINKKRIELFVKQLEDIDRNKNAKERIIEKAIYDFIYSDIEIKHIIIKGEYTEVDFDVFIKECKKYWQTCFDDKVLKEISDYNEEEKNAIAIDIYSSIMNNIELKFKEGFGFTTSNEYLRNGCFLKLSNTPQIGWRPDWDLKYINK
jgi:hypothetical protein